MAGGVPSDQRITNTDNPYAQHSTGVYADSLPFIGHNSEFSVHGHTNTHLRVEINSGVLYYCIKYYARADETVQKYKCVKYL